MVFFLPGRPGEVHFRPDSGDLEAGILRLRRGYRAHGLTVNVIAGGSFLQAALVLNAAGNSPDGLYPRPECHAAVRMRIDVRLHLLFNPHLHGPEFPLLKLRPQCRKGSGKERHSVAAFLRMPVPFIRRAGRRVFRIRGIRRGKSRRGSGGYLPERGGQDVSVRIQGLSDVIF
uniref:Uncharacterized protein n=1 Tax=Klebsiella pneumoniae TaxID=573 RepID=A0A173QMZ2_KLEPN|nr:hypothetical protein [Klebsiella pneumoniae]